MRESSTFSFWEKDTFLKPWDLIVVGAGIVGLSSVLFYKRDRPQSRVLVLDKGFLPRGASTRNAGFACIGSITEHVADMDKESEEIIKERIAMRYRGLQLLRSTLGDEAIRYEPSGGFELFTSKDRFSEAEEYIPKFNRWLQELVGEEEVYANASLNGYPVIHNHLEGMLHPGMMMQTLAKLVISEGVDIRWNYPVAGTPEGGFVALNNGMELKSKQVLIACNGFTPRLLPDVAVCPARGFVMVTNEQQELSWKGTFHHDRGYIYFRNLGNRLLIGGGRNIAREEETTDRFGVNPAIKNYLCRFVDDVLRLPESWKVDYEWSGIMGFTDTKTPVVKRLDDSRVVAAGLSGMGIAIGMQIGREAAGLLNNK